MPKVFIVLATIMGVSFGCDRRDDSQVHEDLPAATGAAEARSPQPVSGPVVPAMTVGATPPTPAPTPPPARAPKPTRLTIEDALASLRAAGLEIRDRADCDAAPAGAAECCDVSIDGTRAEISRYDLRVEQQRRKLEQRAAAGEVERFGPFAVRRIDHPRMPRVREALSAFASPEAAHEPVSLQQITPD